MSDEASYMESHSDKKILFQARRTVSIGHLFETINIVTRATQLPRHPVLILQYEVTPNGGEGEVYEAVEAICHLLDASFLVLWIVLDLAKRPEWTDEHAMNRHLCNGPEHGRYHCDPHVTEVGVMVVLGNIFLHLYGELISIVGEGNYPAKGNHTEHDKDTLHGHGYTCGCWRLIFFDLWFLGG